jgi:hypothetical protein
MLRRRVSAWDEELGAVETGVAILGRYFGSLATCGLWIPALLGHPFRKNDSDVGIKGGPQTQSRGFSRGWYVSMADHRLVGRFHFRHPNSL